jgi:hypothetical protein
VDRCFTERDPAGAEFPDAYSDLVCAEDASFSHETHYDYHSITETIRLNGAQCYKEDSAWGLGLAPYVRWFDSSNTQVAFGAAATDGTGDVAVWCTSGTPSGQPQYVLRGSCRLPTDRCGAKSAGNCP